MQPWRAMEGALTARWHETNHSSPRLRWPLVQINTSYNQPTLRIPEVEIDYSC